MFAIFTWKHLSWSLFLIKLQPFKKRLQYSCFPVNIAKFLRAPILKNTCKQLRKFIQQFGFIRDSWEYPFAKEIEELIVFLSGFVLLWNLSKLKDPVIQVYQKILVFWVKIMTQVFFRRRSSIYFYDCWFRFTCWCRYNCFTSYSRFGVCSLSFEWIECQVFIVDLVQEVVFWVKDSNIKRI